jgi:hypothetical protein
MRHWYIISDIDEFVLATRKLVFNTFGKTSDLKESMEEALNSIKPENQEEFDSVLTQEESLVITKNIARKQTNKKNKKQRYLLTDRLMLSVIEALNDRMVSNMLNGLVNRGVIESAYDSEANDFIFWLKEENEKENKKKHTTD